MVSWRMQFRVPFRPEAERPEVRGLTLAPCAPGLYSCTAARRAPELWRYRKEAKDPEGGSERKRYFRAEMEIDFLATSGAHRPCVQRRPGAPGAPRFRGSSSQGGAIKAQDGTCARALIG